MLSAVVSWIGRRSSSQAQGSLCVTVSDKPERDWIIWRSSEPPFASKRMPGPWSISEHTKSLPFSVGEPSPCCKEIDIGVAVWPSVQRPSASALLLYLNIFTGHWPALSYPPPRHPMPEHDTTDCALELLSWNILALFHSHSSQCRLCLKQWLLHKFSGMFFSF
jgi:hypothetical protein